MQHDPIAATPPLWQDDTARPLAPPSRHLRTRVCVVGLGGTGLSALAEFALAGVDAVGVDAGQIGAGAAGRNGGFLLAGLADFHHDAVERHGRERAAALFRLTLDELEHQLAQGTPGLRACGSLRLAADADEWSDCLRHADALRRDGFAVEEYAGAEGQGLVFPEDGAFRPLAHWRALAAQVEARGVALYGACPVGEVHDDHVELGNGVLVHADAIVVAVDGGLERVLPQLAGRVHSERLQMLATGPAPEVRIERPVYFRYGYDYWQQLADGRIALGGGRDVGGAAERAPAVPSGKVQEYLEGLLRTRVGTRAAVTHRWAAEVAFTDDGLPMFGQIGPRLYVSGAYNGTGNVFGAMCGRELARRVVGQPGELSRWLPDPPV